MDKFCIVTEFCPNGSIDSYLQSHWPSKDIKLDWICGIAAGMTHLCKEGVVSVTHQVGDE